MGSVKRECEAENFLKCKEHSQLSDFLIVPLYFSASMFLSLPMLTGQAAVVQMTIHVTVPLRKQMELSKVSGNYFCCCTMRFLKFQTFHLSKFS